MGWTNPENNWRGFHWISTCQLNFCSVHEIDCERNLIKTQFHSWKPAIYHVKSTHSVINVSILCLNYKLLPTCFSDGEMISSVISGKVRAFPHQFCFPLAIHKRNIVHLISHYSDQTTLLSTMLLDLKTHSGNSFSSSFLSKVLCA